MTEKKEPKFVYQKGLEPGQVQAEFPVKKTTIKPLGEVTEVKKTKKTELNHFGLETSDRPHLESFTDVCVPSRVNKLIDDLEKATSDPTSYATHEVVTELKHEIKKLPECEFIECKIRDMHEINENVAEGKSWDVNGMYVPNTDNGLIPSIEHQIKRLQSRYYAEKHTFEKYPEQKKEAEEHINILKNCLKKLKNIK